MIFHARIHGEVIRIICELLVIITENLERLFKILEDWSLALYI